MKRSIIILILVAAGAAGTYYLSRSDRTQAAGANATNGGGRGGGRGGPGGGGPGGFGGPGGGFGGPGGPPGGGGPRQPMTVELATVKRADLSTTIVVVGNLIGGWQVSGILTARTGLPVNILVTRKASDMPDGNSRNQRPNVVPGVSIYPAHQTIDNWLNPAAFAVPAKGTWGNLGRNVARGPGYWEADIALEKITPVGGKAKVRFRAEAFNVFNHPNFANPAANISATSSFGRITNVLNSGPVGTGTPRRMQFMLRAEF